MPAGGNRKREREYKKLKAQFKKSGRYKGREKQVAARIVNKQRTRYGETKSARQEEEENRSPDRDLPLKNYRRLTIPQILKQVDSKSKREKRKILDYEKGHKNRKKLVRTLEKEV